MKQTTQTTAPSLYVGTYAKYNAGSIAGEWIDLTNFSDADEFLAHCAELHKDEEDPEFMFKILKASLNAFIQNPQIAAT